MAKLGHLIGTRFVNGGRDRRTGLDCWGLVMEVYRYYGIELPDFVVDAFAFQAIDVLAGKATEEREWEEIYYPKDENAPLVVLMRMHPQYITHAGVYLGYNRIIHTTKSTNAIFTRVDAIKGRIAGYYRYVDHNKHT